MVILKHISFTIASIRVHFKPVIYTCSLQIIPKSECPNQYDIIPIFCNQNLLWLAKDPLEGCEPSLRRYKPPEKSLTSSPLLRTKIQMITSKGKR